MQIKFSHKYPKLHNQTSARLVHIITRDRSELPDTFVEYDTVYNFGELYDDTDHYPLPNGKYMILVFVGNEFIPFTTVRRWTEEKFRYYNNNIGNMFEVGYSAAEYNGAVDNRPTTRECGNG